MRSRIRTRNNTKTRETTFINTTNIPQFAYDIALVSQEFEQAQQLLSYIEKEVANIHLQLNTKKTEVMTFDQISVNIRLETVIR